MPRSNRAAVLAIASALAASPALVVADEPAATRPLTTADVLAGSTASDWRALDTDNTLYLELERGRVVIELAPRFAPGHVANIKALVREGYFDSLAIIRSQDNYVVQWGDPDGADEAKRKPIENAKRTLPAEFTTAARAELPFTRLADGDLYAPEAGWSDSLPAARDGRGRTWLAHCYGMVGAGRDNGADTGGGTELYVVIGHAPRHLDRNVTLVGRVMQGMELLSTLPRGTGALGFYEQPEQRVPIKRVRVAADVPAAERVALEVLRTNTQTFAKLVEARRHRREEWFLDPVGHVELCNVPIPVRPRAP
jgi:peptidylprolyl isomerase